MPAMNFQVFFSNQVEKLYDQLKHHLFGRATSPFERRLVIVPSPAMKSWLMLRMAQDLELGVAAGMEIAYLDDSIFKMLAQYSECPEIMTPFETAFRVEWEIRQAIENGEKDWDALRSYFGISVNTKLPARSHRRLGALASSLTSLFQRYAKYGNGMVDAWDKGSERGWQQELWRILFEKKQYLYRALKSDLSIPGEVLLSVHLFSLSFLPKVYHDFLLRLSKQRPVNYYMLSPCEVFWSDIKSDRERIHLRHFWEKREAREGQLDKLDDYLKDCNPLLANFGRLGREMAQMLETGDVISHEEYTSQEDPSTLLRSVQHDLLTLRNPESEGKIVLDQYDKTIQIHASPTPLREIEVLKDLLLGIFQKHNADEDPITPRDVIVMAPDIMKYEPFIKMVFQSGRGDIDVQIMDLKMPAQSPLIQAFMLFMELPFSRWEGATLLQFLEQPSVRKKQGWNQEELAYLRSWIDKCGIRWGLDEHHRNEMISRRHEKPANFESTGTWKFGFSKMIRSMVLEGDHDVEIDLPQAEFLGNLILYLEAIRNDTQLFVEDQMLSLKEWSEKLKELFQKYFVDYEGLDESKMLMRLFSQIAKAGRDMPEATYPFISVKRYLQEALTSQSTSYRESHLNAVRFCSLLPMRAIPAKVIVLLGMEEGAFPRLEENFSLNLLKNHPKADYCPSQTDFDRYLFLEALISARDYFILSYSDHKEEGFKEQLPSLLVTELLGYLDNSYEVGKNKISKLCVKKHSYNAFDKSYFEEGSDFPSFSSDRFKEACAYYLSEKKEDHRFIPHFSLNKVPELSRHISITIADLTSSVSNPLKLYFTKGLGIYVDKVKEEKIDIKLTMNPLEKHIVLNDSLKVPPEILLEQLERSGKLPEGPFLEPAKTALAMELDEAHQKISDLDINLEDLIRIELTPHTNTPIFDTGIWKFPPFKIVHRDSIVEITGTIDSITHEGLIVNGQLDLKKQVKEIARAVTLLYLIKNYSLDIKKQLIFIKAKKKVLLPDQDPEVLMQQLLDFYFKVKENPSPLLPEWIESILTKSGDDIVDDIIAKEGGYYTTSFNEYSKWIMRGSDLPNYEKLLSSWSAVVENLYVPFNIDNGKKKR